MVQTNLGMNERRTLVADAITDISVGTDDTPASATDVALGAQVEINAIESRTDGATGISVVRMRLLAAEAVATLVEVGTWSVTPALMDHVIFSPLPKSNLVEVLIDVTLEVS